LANDKLNVLLTGPNANSMWAMCGDYSFPAMTYFWKMNMEDLEHPEVVTLFEGMTANKPEGVNLMYSRGCDWTEVVETKYAELGDERAWETALLHRKVDAGEKIDKAEAMAMAKKSDVMLCGENRDRQGLRLPGKQEEYIKELLATGKPVVLIVFGGRAQVISGIAEQCAAVIQAWYPGEEGGKAVADILYGKISPSAKLSVSYPKEEVYEPICYNYATEKDSRVQWPFGYGLSYTTFEYQNMKADAEVATSAESVNVSFDVKNSGKMAADEIVQIYLSPTGNNQQIRPIQLQGFARVSLQPGETKTVKVKLYTEQFGYYSNQDNRQWNIAPGQFIVKIGASSTDIRLQQTVTLKGDAVIKPLRDHYFSEATTM
jgi:beta-glucosidase